MYLWGDDCTSFSLSPADTLTEAKAALIAAGIIEPSDQAPLGIGRASGSIRGSVAPERRSAEVIDFAAYRSAKADPRRAARARECG